MSAPKDLRQLSVERERLALLSPREIQTLAWLAIGRTCREIAKLMGISVKTVDTHRLHLLKKLEVDNAVKLCRLAIRHELVAIFVDLPTKAFEELLEQSKAARAAKPKADP